MAEFRGDPEELWFRIQARVFGICKDWVRSLGDLSVMEVSSGISQDVAYIVMGELDDIYLEVNRMRGRIKKLCVGTSGNSTHTRRLSKTGGVVKTKKGRVR